MYVQSLHVVSLLKMCSLIVKTIVLRLSSEVQLSFHLQLQDKLRTPLLLLNVKILLLGL